jgi:hypothetical protein
MGAYESSKVVSALESRNCPVHLDKAIDYREQMRTLLNWTMRRTKRLSFSRQEETVVNDEWVVWAVPRMYHGALCVKPAVLRQMNYKAAPCVIEIQYDLIYQRYEQSNDRKLTLICPDTGLNETRPAAVS